MVRVLFFPVLVAVVLASFASVSNGMFYEYEDDSLDSPRLYRFGMFSPSDAPSKTSPGDGRSYINADLRITARDGDTEAFVNNNVYFAVFHSRYSEAVGVFLPNSHFTKLYCDGEDMLRWNLASNQSTEYQLWSFPVYALVRENMSTVPIHTEFNVVESGLYYMLFVSCGSGSSSVVVDGSVEVMNPYGHLLGTHFGMMPFYGFMFASLMVLLVPWVILNIQWKREILRVQHLMTAIFVITIIEAVTYLAFYAHQNETGRLDRPGLVWQILITLIRKTFSRVLVLSVAFGFGVVRPTLGKTMNKIFAASILYFLCAGGLEWAQANYAAGHISLETATLFAIPVAILDALFYMVTFRALADTVSELRARRQAVKILLYTRFINTLIFYVVFSVLWIIFEGFWAASGSFESHWSVQWMFEAVWFFGYVAVFLTMCVLWRPSENNTRYAFSLDMSMIDEVDEEELAQVSVGLGHSGGTLRTRSVRASDTHTLAHGSRSPAQRVHPLTNFSLAEEDDEEEDAVLIHQVGTADVRRAPRSGENADETEDDRLGAPTLLRQPTEEEEEDAAGRPLLG
eukprot:ANDGO_07009.mRNA.1 hypothetical protein